MQLLGASVTPNPEFVSLSLLVKPQASNDTIASFGEPLTLVAPAATVSAVSADQALVELQTHIAHILLATASKGSTSEDSVSMELLQSDEKLLLTSMQLYRPCTCNGVGMYYRVVLPRDGPLFSSFAPLPMSSGHNSSSASKTDLSKIQGVVLCVGVSGFAAAYCGSSLQYTLNQRMNDCLGILGKVGTSDLKAVKTILSSFLVQDDDLKRSNMSVDAGNSILLPDDPKGSAQTRLARKASSTSTRPGEKTTSTQEWKVSMEPQNPAENARTVVDQMTLLSVVETGTLIRKYETSGQQRRANLDFSGGSKSRFRRKKGDAKDADFDNFDCKGALIARRSSEKMLSGKSDSKQDAATPLAKPKQFKGPKKDTKTKGASVPALSAPKGDASHPSRRKTTHSNHSKTQFDDESSDLFKGGGGTVNGLHRVQVNIALNEDLTCSYKESQLSSCNVEGIVQVQLKSNIAGTTPFQLLVRDPSSQIASLQENRKFATDSTGELDRDGERDYADRKFTVQVPKPDSYFPVLRYKCSTDLRPVPIRVQTKVKVDPGACRVALQISSNPNNSASLTDLTIIMNAPEFVIGSSLMTQPAGGVWDGEKNGVIWCVSELGGGEKFQLQARFETVGDRVSKDSLHFPVMVRCQCLFAQLSEIELEVRDTPQDSLAEMTMKVARRFRLSHRERS